MFCTLLFNFVSYVLLLLCLGIPIVIYTLFSISCFHRTKWHSSATLTEVFPCFSSVVRQIPGFNSQRRGTAHTFPKLIVLFCVLFVCVCTVLLSPGVNPTAVNKYLSTYLSTYLPIYLSIYLSIVLSIYLYNSYYVF